MRKVIIYITTLLFVVLAFVVYKNLVDSPVITPEDHDFSVQNSVIEEDLQTNEIEEVAGENQSVEAVSDDFGKVDKDTRIGTADQLDYKQYYPNGRIKSSFGCDKLLTKGQSLWTIEKPYMNMFELKYNCKVTADRGNVRVEDNGGDITPRDADLRGNVIIEITLKEDGKQYTILMDDLIYESQRTEFVTKGPVQIVSEDIRMDGVGLNLIFNPKLGRVEFLKINRIDSLIARSDSLGTSNSSNIKVQTENTVYTSNASEASDIEVKSVEALKADDSSQIRYSCVLSKDVVIKRDGFTINAENVNVTNILWGKEKKEDSWKSDTLENKTPTLERDVVGDESIAGSKVDESLAFRIKPLDELEESELLQLSCAGGVVFKPMNTILETDDKFKNIKQKRVRITGSPVVIKRFVIGAGKDLTAARCGIIDYDLDTEVVFLRPSDSFSNVFLNDIEGSNGALQSSGFVMVDRNNSEAEVIGPGRIDFVSKKKVDSSADGNFDFGNNDFEMTFRDKMSLFFSRDLNSSKSNQMLMKLVNIEGGFNVVYAGDQQGNIKSDKATIEFNEKGESKGISLVGNVVFDDKEGVLESSRARIVMGESEGKMRPLEFIAYENPVLRPATDALHPEGKAELKASQLNYYFDKNLAIAHGPAVLSALTDMREDSKTTTLTPINVSAQGNAIFYMDKKEFVFSKEVVGDITRTNDREVETTTFNGDKLTIKLGNEIVKNPDGGVLGVELSDKLNSILLEGENVLMRSKTTLGSNKLTDVSLSAKEINFDKTANMIVAKGPGVIDIANHQQAKDSSSGKMDFDGPCYARVKDFSLLNWDMAKQIVNGYGTDDRMLSISYLPVNDDGSYGSGRTIDTGEMEARFKKTELGKNKLINFTADNNVKYEDSDKNFFLGERLEYQVYNNLVKVYGSKSRPCVYNGQQVDGIIFNPATKDVSFEILGNSTLPSK